MHSDDNGPKKEGLSYKFRIFPETIVRKVVGGGEYRWRCYCTIYLFVVVVVVVVSNSSGLLTLFCL